VVSFPPEDAGRDSGAGEHLAPVTYLRDARRAGTSTEDEARREGLREHPSARRTPRPAVAFPGAERSGAEQSGVAAAERDGGPAGRSESGAGESDGGDEPRSDERTGKRASNVSMHQLARRGMSRWELEQVLAKREIDPAIAEAELDRLESVGLLDDAALAVTLVYTQHTRKGLGRTAIAQELKRRHIDPDIIEEALAEIADDDELERATELAVKRIGQMSSYDDDTVKRRLNGFLARKGYSSGVVRQAMDAAFASRGKRGVRFQ
jgi:regulatory protein